MLLNKFSINTNIIYPKPEMIFTQLNSRVSIQSLSLSLFSINLNYNKHNQKLSKTYQSSSIILVIIEINHVTNKVETLT